jgi:hypothetical protein
MILIQQTQDDLMVHAFVIGFDIEASNILELIAKPLAVAYRTFNTTMARNVSASTAQLLFCLMVKVILCLF